MIPVARYSSFDQFTQAELAAWIAGCTPGVRMSLSSTLAVTDSVSGGTSLWAHPYNGGVVSLWGDAAGTQPVLRLITSPVQEALGTLGSGSLPNDVYMFPTQTGIDFDFTAWSSDTAPPTRMAKNGRLYKNNDASRLLVAAFKPTSTTVTQDTAAQRYLSNIYNTAMRRMMSVSGTSHTVPGNTSDREWFNSTNTLPRCEFLMAVAGMPVLAYMLARVNTNVESLELAIGLNGSNNGLTFTTMGNITGGWTLPYPNLNTLTPGVGYNFLTIRERTFTAAASGSIDFGVTGGFIWN